MIYLDNAATTKVSQSVIDAMIPWMNSDYGNPGSIHSMGRKAATAIEKARRQVALPINADPENIIFTSGGSEANSLAICGLENYLRKTGKTHIITTAVEHSSVLESIKSLFYKGFETTYCGIESNGLLNIAQLEAALKDNTALVSVMGANNETGTEFHIRKIGELCHERGILFHTDCVQAYGNREINVDSFHIDFLSASAHKFHGPKGVGFLYAKHKEFLEPFIHGGNQEHGLRAGTENTASIVGMGQAAEDYFYDMESHREYISKLRHLFIMVLAEAFDGDPKAFQLNGRPFYGQRTINILFDGVDGETLVLLLDKKGVVTSAGAACHAHLSEPSHVLKALGLTDEQARSSIRVSFSPENTYDEIIDAANIIAESVKLLRGES